MKQFINEVKRMQKLAGILSEEEQITRAGKYIQGDRSLPAAEPMLPGKDPDSASKAPQSDKPSTTGGGEAAIVLVDKQTSVLPKAKVTISGYKKDGNKASGKVTKVEKTDNKPLITNIESLKGADVSITYNGDRIQFDFRAAGRQKSLDFSWIKEDSTGY